MGFISETAQCSPRRVPPGIRDDRSEVMGWEVGLIEVIAFIYFIGPDPQASVRFG